MLGIRQKRWKSMAVAAWLASAGLLGAPAMAAELDQASSLKIEVHGTVTERCAISSPGDVNLGNLNQAGRHTELKFGLDCNVPFNMTVAAERGALANREFPLGQGPYAGSLPYQFDLSIPVRKPSSSTVTRSFKSSDLVGGGQSFSSGGGIATQGMDARVTLGRAGGIAGLLGGDYSETINITISVI